MEIVIKRITLNDAEVLADMASRTFSDTFSGTCSDADMQQFLNENYNLQQVKNELTNDVDFYFFALIDDKPAGYIRMMEDYSNFPLMKKWKALELKRIYVEKEFHGIGLAQQMMKFIEVFSRDNFYEVLWLGVWEHNNRAKKFYEKCGFKDSGYTHDFPIGDTPQTDNWLWKFLEK